MCRPLRVRVWKKEHQQWESTGRSCGKAQLTRSIFPSAVKMKSARKYSIVQSGRAGKLWGVPQFIKRWIYFRLSLSSGRRWARCYGEHQAKEEFRMEASRLPVGQCFAERRGITSGEITPLTFWWSHLRRCMKETEAADLRGNHADIIPGYQTSVVSVWVKNGPSCCASVFTNVSSHAHYRSKLLHKRGPGLRCEEDATQHGFRAADVMFLNKKINLEELCCHATCHN